MYSIIKNGGEAVVTVFDPATWSEPKVAKASHPNYTDIVEELQEAEEGYVEPDYGLLLSLFDVPESIARKFEPITTRVTVHDKRVYFDGDEVDGSIAHQIIRVFSEGTSFYGDGGLYALAYFLEQVQANPSENSRAQLYDFLRAHEFTILPNGSFMAYKGVRNGRSLNRGTAIVNGEEVTGQIPNAIGSIVSMPRSQVEDNPSVGCSRGLHVATRDFANSFGDEVLEVAVSPTDVVSVPVDGAGEKVRVCRYYVKGKSAAERTEAYLDEEAPVDW